jgi:hypothetical protein
MTLRNPDIITKPDSVKKERAIAEALREYRRAECEPASSLLQSGSLFPQWKGFAAGVFATLLLVWLVLPGKAVIPSTIPQNNELAALTEMQKLFGDQLKGIVMEGNQIQPVLSSGGEAFTRSQPILITLQQGGKTSRILCYSGNVISIPVQGKDITINAYVDEKGNAVVEGKDFLWSQGKTLGTAPVTLDAKPVGASL